MKRQRFTVYARLSSAEEDQRYIILGYTAESVREHFERRGYDVLGVERGDYRKRERVERVRAAAEGFKLDHAAIKRACEALDVRLPVKIRLDGRVGGTQGRHRWRVGERAHRIMVKSYLPASRASEVLWHELTHAMQAERAERDGRGWVAVSNAERRTPYRTRPIEVEARNNERRASTHPLALSL